MHNDHNLIPAIPTPDGLKTATRWQQLHQNAAQLIALLAFAATAIKTGLWYQLTGLAALLLNGNLLLMSGFFCLFALTYASTHPGRATLAAAGGVLIAVLV